MTCEKTCAEYTREFSVRSYETDIHGKASLPSICRYLQETADHHSRKLGNSIEILIGRGLTWVLSRMHIQMSGYPAWRDRLVIETWPSELSPLYALREFRISDESGGIIGLATTSWMIIDLKTRKPVDITTVVPHSMNLRSDRAIDDPFERMPRMDTFESGKEFPIKLSDRDINGHVNNVHYIDWALEAVPHEIHHSHRLSELEISYRAELNTPGTVRSEIHQEPLTEGKYTFIHRLIRMQDNREAACLRTQWT